MTEITNAKLRAFHGDPALKAAFLEQIGQHEVADMIVKGTYGKSVDGGWKGCAIGCSLRSLNKIQGKAKIDRATGDHERFPPELGLPLWLAYFEDNIFEWLPNELSKTWPRRLAEAIPAGACVDDLVLAKILRWTLGAEPFGVRYAATDAAVVAVVDRMVALFDRTIRGDEPTSNEWDEAARATWDTTRDVRAARAAWDVRAARAARAAWAVKDVWNVWDVRAARAADTRDAFYPALSEYVLSLLRELPMQCLQERSGRTG